MADTRRLKKILLIAALVAVVLAVGAAFALHALVDVDRYRPFIESKAREKLGREVELGELGLSLFPMPAVTVSSLRVADEAEGDLVTAGTVRLGAQLMPLLSGRLAIDRIVVEEPVILMRRLADGRWELLDLLDKGEGSGEEARVSVDSLRLRGGRVVIEDGALEQGRVVRHELTALDLDLSGLDRKGGELDVQVAAKMPSLSPEAGFAWRGKVARDGRRMDGALTLEAIELAPLAAQVSALTGRDLSALRGRIAGRFDLRREAGGAFTVDGKGSARGLVVPRAGSAPAVVPDLDLDLDLAADGKGDLDLERFSLETGGLHLTASGRFTTEPEQRVLLLDVPEAAMPLAPLKDLAELAGMGRWLRGLSGEKVRIGGRLRAVFAKEQLSLRRLDLDGLRVRGLTVAVARGRDGRFDFQAPASEATKKGASGPSFSIRDAVLSDIDLRFEDRAVADVPVLTRISDLELELKEWVPGRTTPLRLSGRIDGGRVSIDGSAGPITKERLPLDLRVDLEDLDVASIAPYLKRYSGFGIESGRLDAQTKVSGSTAEFLRLEGRLAIDGAEVEVKGRTRELDLSIEHDLSVENDGGRVRLSRLSVGLPSGPIVLDGLIELPEGGPSTFDVGTRGPARLTPEDLRHLLALVGVRTGVEMEAQEPMVLDGRLKKGREGFSAAGRAQLRQVVVRHALLGTTALQVASADVDLAGQRVSMTGLRLRLGATDLTGSLALTGFDRHRVSFDLSSGSADLDELFAFVGRDGTGEGRGAVAPRSDDGLGRTTADGRLRVGRATWGNLAFTSFDANIGLKDRRLTVKRSAVELYGGSAVAEMNADLSKAPAGYDTNGTLSSVQVKDLLAAGLGYSDLSGLGSGTFRLSGTAGPPAVSVRAARGQGTLDIRQGRIAGLNMLAALREAEVFGESSLSRLGSRLAEEGTSFDRLDAEYALGDGVLRLSRLVTETPDARIDAKGNIHLLEQRLDLDADIVLSRELSEQMRAEGSRAAQLMWNEREGAVRFPCKLVGPLSKPRVVIDWESAIGQFAQGELGRRLERGLGDLLGGGRRQEPEPTTSPPASGGGAVSPETPSSFPPAEGAPTVRVKRARLSGNFLVPDVKVEALLSGTDLLGATVVVSDSDGKELHRDENAFVSAVNAHYAAGAARDRPTSLDVAWELDGERIAGRRGLRVVITPRTRAGVLGPSASEAVAAKSLF